MKRLLLAFLAVVVLCFAALAWDISQLRALRPPDDRTFEGFVRAGRHGAILIDSAAGRMYWTAPPRKTFVTYTDHVYQFDRSGRLVNWTPGTDDQKGMFFDSPVRRSGAPATVDEARAWIRRN